MAAFIFEGRGKDQRNGHERIAMSNIRGAINWIVGGYYNCIQDGCEEYLPQSRESLEAEIYSSALNNAYGPGFEASGKAPKEMRFAGETFCKAYIRWKLDQDGDFIEIASVQGW